MVFVREAADNGAVHANVSRVRRVGGIDKDVPRVHVRVKETVAKHLREKYLDTAFAEQFEVGALCLECLDVGDGNVLDIVPSGATPT